MSDISPAGKDGLKERRCEQYGGTAVTALKGAVRMGPCNRVSKKPNDGRDTEKPPQPVFRAES